MNELNFSDNIVKLRHKKKITQEQLADFIGVTKASVSKWENKQTLPDILILPELAAFFDVTIDELLGYEPQLSKEQIQKLYLELTEAFAESPFEEVMKKSEELTKKYYSCYPFLFQIACLWINHFMIAENQTRQTEILISISNLCSHIISNCRNISICNDSIILKSFADLQLGRAQEVIDSLEEMFNPCHLSVQNDTILLQAQAYQMNGQNDKADSITQINMFSHLLNLIENATWYITINSDNLSACESTIERMNHIFAAYDLEYLHPNSVAGFYYQAAIVYCLHDKTQKAINKLERYAACIKKLWENEAVLHGDSYFTSIESWFEQLNIGNHAPRDKRIIINSAISALSHPAFTILSDMTAYQKIKQSLSEKGGIL